MKKLLAVLFLFTVQALAQTATPIPFIIPTYLDSSGNPLNSGMIFTYAAGTETPLATYSDAYKVGTNANPVILASTGRPTTGGIFLSAACYKIVAQNSSGVQQWSADNICDLANLFTLNFATKIDDKVVHCSQYTGSDFDDKWTAAVAALPATGGTADCRGLEGAQTANATMTASKPVITLIGATTLTSTASGAIYALNSAGSGIQCLSPGASILYTSSTAADGINRGADNVFVRQCTIRGPSGGTLRAGFSGIDMGSTTTGGIDADNIVENWGGHCINTGGHDNYRAINNIVRSCYQDGILLAEGSSGAKINFNKLYDIGSNGIDCGGCFSSEIIGNELINCGANYVASNDGHCILVYTSGINTSDILVQGNTIDGSYNAGISVKAFVGFTVKDWKILNNFVKNGVNNVGQACILVDGSGASAGTMTHGDISHNTCRDQADAEAAFLVNATVGTLSNIKISFNTAISTTGSPGRGFWVSGGTDIWAMFNTSLSNAAADVWGGGGSSFAFCTITTTTDAGCTFQDGNMISFTVANSAAVDNTFLEWNSSVADHGTFRWFLDQFNKFVAYNVDTAQNDIEIDSGDIVNIPVALKIGGNAAITDHYSAAAALDFAAWSGADCQDLTITVTGAADGNTVVLGVPLALSATAGVQFTGTVSAADTVTVRGCKITAGASANPAAAAVRADVWKH